MINNIPYTIPKIERRIESGYYKNVDVKQALKHDIKEQYNVLENTKADELFELIWQAQIWREQKDIPVLYHNTISLFEKYLRLTEN